MISFDKKVVLDRLALLKEYINQLHELKGLSKEEFLADFKNHYTTERLFQITIESCIDIGNHLIAMNTWGKPITYRQIFEILSQKNILTHDVGESFQRVVGFRNILVHHYSNVDKEVVYSLLQDNLDDFTSFSRQIITMLNLKDNSREILAKEEDQGGKNQ